MRYNAMKLRARQMSEEDHDFISLLTADSSTNILGNDISAAPVNTAGNHPETTPEENPAPHRLIIEQISETGSLTPLAAITISESREFTAQFTNSAVQHRLETAIIRSAIAYSRRDPGIKNITIQVNQNDKASHDICTQAGFIQTGNITLGDDTYIRYVYTIPRRQFGLFY